MMNMDIIFSVKSPSNSFYAEARLLRNRGNGSFEKSVEIGYLYNLQLILPFDANNDGWIDVFLFNAERHFLLTNKGIAENRTLAFDAERVPGLKNVIAGFAADVNNDG